MRAARPTVFVCYSWDDRFVCEQVRARLATLDDARLINVWRDTEEVRAGDRLHDEIAAAIDRSQIAVLLISDSLMHADGYAWKHEVPRITARAERDGLTVMPLYVAKTTLDLASCPWSDNALVNKPDRPLAGLSADEAAHVLDKLVDAIRERVRRIDAAQPPVDWVAALTRGVVGKTAERVRAFIDEYVSAPQHPVAFGGRATTLSALRAWIDDDETASHCFMVAPTGLGKSAVACHLVRSLAARSDLAVAFLPVSLRFGTSHTEALQTALVDRVLYLHGDRPLGQADLDTTLAALTEKLRRSLPNGRRLLVVVDGLDEAADWQFGAGTLRNPATGTKVLISMRGVAGIDAPALRDRLGLPAGCVCVETLAPLDDGEIGEALRSAGRGDLTGDPVRLARMVTLCEGDPLVLHLLLDELTDRGDDAFFATTPSLRTGLGGIWERQLTDADRDAFGEHGATTALFGVLAHALGPIGRDDLMAMAPDHFPNGMVLDQVLRRWHRFVLRAEAGFSFCHSRLREHYAEAVMGTRERNHWQSRLLDYGRAAVAHLGAAPAPTPSPFLIQFHGAHLERYGGTIDDRAMLVTAAWRNAWAQHPGGDAGFVCDVERAWNAAVAATRDGVTTGRRPAIATAIRCALTRATLRSESQNLRPPLVRELLAREFWTPVRALAHHASMLDLGTDDDRDQLPKLFEVIRPFLATRSLRLAGLDVAARLADRCSIVEPWLGLAADLAADDLAALEASARRLHYASHRCRALFAIADAHADQGQRDDLQREASAILRSMDSPHHQVGALESIGTGLAALDTSERDDLLVLVRTKIAGLPNPDHRAALSVRLAKRLDGAHRSRFALDAYEAASFDDPLDVRRVLDIIPLLPAAQARGAVDRLLASDLDGVVDTLLHRANNPNQPDAWSRLSSYLDGRQRDALATAWIDAVLTHEWPSVREVANAGFADRVLAAVEGLSPDRRDDALTRLAPYLHSDQQLALVARIVSTEDVMVQWLDEVVDMLAATRTDEVTAILANSVDAMATAHCLLRVAARVDDDRRAGCVAQARAATRRIPGAFDRIRLLATALELVPSDDTFTELLAELDRLPATELRRTHFALIGTLERIPLQHRDELRRHLTLFDDDEIDWLSPNAGERLRAVGRPGLSRVQAGWPRVECALMLASHLDGVEATGALQDALAAARAVGDSATIVATLLQLRPTAEICQRTFERACALSSLEERFAALSLLGESACAHAEAARHDALEAARRLAHRPPQGPRYYFLRHASPDAQAPILARLFDEVHRGLRAGDDSRTFGEGPRQRARYLLTEIGGCLTPDHAAEVLALLPEDWTLQAVLLLRAASRDAARRQRCTDALAETIAVAREQRIEDRALTLAAALPALAGPDRDALIDELLADASGFYKDETTDDTGRAMLQNLAPYLDERHLPRVAALALNAWESRTDIARFVRSLGVPLDRRERFAEDLYVAARARGDRPMVVAGLLPLLPDAALADVVDALARCTNRSMLEIVIDQAARFTTPQLERLLAIVAPAIRARRSAPHDVHVRVLGAIGAVVIHRDRAHIGMVQELVVEILRTSSAGRPEVLSAIAGLAPLLRELVGADGIDAIAGEILDVTGWWP